MAYSVNAVNAFNFFYSLPEYKKVWLVEHFAKKTKVHLFQISEVSFNHMDTFIDCDNIVATMTECEDAHDRGRNTCSYFYKGEFEFDPGDLINYNNDRDAINSAIKSWTKENVRDFFKVDEDLKKFVLDDEKTFDHFIWPKESVV